MKKTDWALVLVPMFLTIGLDQATKLWALSLEYGFFYGPMGFSLHFNKGAMLGLFSDLPPILRVVSLSTGGAFIFFTYVIIQYLLPVKSLPLRSGLSFLMGGILGNVIDRSLYGHVVDFLFFKLGTWNSPVMNIADILQWVGYVLIVYTLVRDGELFWPEKNLRKYYWINPYYQIRYCFTLVFVGVGFAIISGVFSYTFLKFVLEDVSHIQKAELNKYLMPFVFTFSIFSVAFASFLFMIGKILSHRTAGPVYAFERFTNQLISGESHPLKLRQGDEFKQLEKLSQKMVDHLQTKTTSHNEVVPLLPRGQANGFSEEFSEKPSLSS